MLRRTLCAAFALAVCVGLGWADEIRGVIIKVDGKNVTFAESKGKGQRGESRTLPAAANIKVDQGRYNEDTKQLTAGDPVAEGLKAQVFSRIDEKTGVRALIVTDAANQKIAEIRLFPRKKNP